MSLDDANNNFAKKSDITSIYRPKGTKPTYDDLPTTGNEVGDVWNVASDDRNYAWTVDGTWDPLGSKIEIGSISNDTIDQIVAGTSE